MTTGNRVQHLLMWSPVSVMLMMSNGTILFSEKSG